MKCTNRLQVRVTGLVLAMVLLLAGCSQNRLTMKYSQDIELQESIGKESEVLEASGFAADLCTVVENVSAEGITSSNTPAGIFNISTRQVVYANQVHERVYPASITKIMTALLFFQHYSGDFTDTMTVSQNIAVTESGSQTCGFQNGDTVTLDQVLNGLLVYSGNDAANIIAEYVAGSVEAFVEMMNEEAARIGATNTNFTNPHGLSDDNHYTTVYDLYLIFQKVSQYEKFIEVIKQPEYSCEYKKANGTMKKVTWKSTNQLLTGDKEIPENVTVLGGKTGTTNAAGSCLILFSQNQKNEQYISVVMKTADKNALYEKMTELLTKTSN